MSKTVFMLSTSRCGYCRQARQMINAKYPNAESDGLFRYFQYDTDEVADDHSKEVLTVAQQSGIRGVPFTVLLDNGKATKGVRGFDPGGIEQLILEAINGAVTGIDE